MKLGHYRLLGRIAVGGMAELYEAQDERSGQQVVVKLVLPQYAADPDFLQMLADEARLARQLEHPHLVRLLDAELGRQPPYLVLERVAGPALSRVLQAARQARRPPPPAVALELSRQLLLALRYLHQLSGEDGRPLEVVHRDVTPGNVLLDLDSGQLKLGDFGIAQHRLRGVRTRTGVIKGTVQYMAPEQVTASGVDARSDLYGVGLILYELLTLRPVIHAETEVELLRVAEDPPWTPPSRLRPELPAVLDPLLRRALQRFPEQRFPSAEAFLEQLQPTLDQLTPEPPSAASWVAELDTAQLPLAAPLPLPAPATPASGTPETAAAGPRSTARSWRWLGLGALLLPLGFGALLVLRSDGQLADRRARPTVDRAAKAPLDAAVVDGQRPSTPRPDISVADAAAADATAPDAAAGPRRRGQRTAVHGRPAHGAVPSRRRPADAGRAATADLRPAADDPTPAQRARARLSAARTALRQRGILVEDLPATLRSTLESMGRQLAAGSAPKEAALGQLLHQLAGVRPDHRLVEAKLKRVDGRLRRAGSRAPARLRDLAGLALQAFMDRDYAGANRQLNRILAGLNGR